ncbi:alpha/beta fold hydrolase [Roseivirga thermotolerans]|uniref:Proline iminopeptidase n=1 Tax=Roseivirga thermotolerans TaxID=1758176 RepID=A0ABQ3I416_9BACT|nr:alpha/beta fold hydrolase [Roseivirga thermotolerans]GHE59928.1 proline iminopeptidase [Roseivirga thermotolerans]
MLKRNYIVSLLLLFMLMACGSSSSEMKQGYMIVSGSDVYYKTMGSGDPLLVIHGGPVLDHSYFLPHLEELAKDYRLIFYDQRACGKSSLSIDSATMNLNGFVDDIEQIRTKLGHEKLHIMGHSWGGLLAMKYAMAYPDKVERLILANSMAPSSADWQKENLAAANNIDPKDKRRLDNIVSTGLLRTPNPVPYIKEMMLLSFKAQFFDKLKIDQLNLNIPEDFQKRSAVFGLLGPDLAQYNLYADLKKIKAPALVMYGDAEAAINLHARKMVDSLNNGRLKVIPTSGHFPFIENPIAFNRAVRDFLDD